MKALLIAAYAAVNLVTFCLYGADKRRAQKGRWRISERTLLTFTWLMGGAGAWLGMRVFRHKTKHMAFRISAPLAALVSLGAMAWMLVQ